MQRILVRSAKDPLLPVAPEVCLAQNLLGTNSGNLLFGQAVHRALTVPGTEVVSDSYSTQKESADGAFAERINESFDAFVVPLANAFRPAFQPQLDQLTGLIRRLRIPVVVVGVGAQISGENGTAPPEIAGSVRDFMSAVLDRSGSVGVRGDITRRYLAGLGFGDEHVEVIGCPSLFDAGPDLHVVPPSERLTPDSRLVLNVTPAVPRMAAVVEHHTRAYPRSVLVPQHTDQLALMLWGEDADPVKDPRMPVHTGHPLYRQDRMRFFVDPRTWVDFMREHDFAMGSRIHGNIAALLAGTPAYVLTFDSRTSELAEYHQIPHRSLRSMPADADAADLLESADYTGFNAAHRGLFETFTSFLEKNGLEHTYRAGDQGRHFEQQLREADLPPPVQTLFAPGEAGREQILQRLRWLRQGTRGDRNRPRYRYDAPFAPEGTRSRGDSERMAKEIASLRRRLDRQSKRLDRQAARVDRQARRLERQDGRITRLADTRRTPWRDRLRGLLRRGD